MHWHALGGASKCLVIYGALMLLACVVTYAGSVSDPRLIRGVGVWVKPMKFMAATALFALTTVWALKVADAKVEFTVTFQWIAVLIISTSLFEVIYITYQGFHAQASHYNVNDPFHTFMFGLMGVAAVGLTASQAWLAWEIWLEKRGPDIPVEVLGVILGLAMTFVLSTISGFMLGGHQPPAGQGWPIVGWHVSKVIRPAHFLGVHAQQLIPIWGLLVAKWFGGLPHTVLLGGATLYVLVWGIATWFSL